MRSFHGPYRSLLLTLPDVEAVARTGFRRKLLGAVLARKSVANLELVAVQDVDAQHGLALEGAFRVSDVDGLGCFRRFQLVRPLEDRVAFLDGVLVALKGQPGLLGASADTFLPSFSPETSTQVPSSLFKSFGASAKTRRPAARYSA